MAGKSKINRDLTLEFATDAPDVNITGSYLGNIRINEDKVLRELGGNLAVYEDVYRDDRVKSCLQQRVTAVTSRDYDVRAGGDSALDKKAAAAAGDMIRSLRFDRLTERFLLQALLKGWGVGEIIWSLKDNLIWPAAIRVKRSQRFGFAPLHTSTPASNSYDDVKRALRLESVLRLKTRSAPHEGISLPARKFIVHSVGGLDDDNPFGTGLGFWLYWPVRFKREGMGLWLQFIDKFGSPSAKGTYPANAGEADKRKLLDALRALRSNSVTAVPEGMTVELIEAAKSGISTHEQLIDRMDQAITTAILSQTLTTSQGNTGSQALGTVHEGIKDGVAKADADLLSDTLNETLMYWFNEFNFSGAAVPHIWRDMADVEDLNSKADRDLKLSQASGRNLDAGYVEEQYDVKLGDAPRPGQIPPGPPLSKGGAFAEVSGSSVGSSPQPASFISAQTAKPGKTGDSLLSSPAKPEAGKSETVPGFSETAPVLSPASFAETAQQKHADPHPGRPLADKLAADTAAPMQAWLDQISNMAENAQSLDELYAQLIDAYGSLDSDEMARVMQFGFAAAELAGRYDVAQGK